MEGLRGAEICFLLSGMCLFINLMGLWLSVASEGRRDGEGNRSWLPARVWAGLGKVAELFLKVLVQTTQLNWWWEPRLLLLLSVSTAGFLLLHSAWGDSKGPSSVS